MKTIQLKNRSRRVIFTYTKENNSVKATVIEAIRQGIDLSGVDLRWVDLNNANLKGAILFGADLYKADLTGVDLYNADLNNANLHGVNLSYANLRGVNLIYVNLNGTMFTHSNPVLEQCKWRISIMSDDMIAIGCEIKSIADWDIWFTGNEVYTTPRDTDEFKLIQNNYINVRDFILIKD